MPAIFKIFWLNVKWIYWILNVPKVPIFFKGGGNQKIDLNHYD